MPFTHSDYTIAVICPKGAELAPVQALLDDTHPPLPVNSKKGTSYVLGRMGEHNIVIAVLPDIGNNKAATVATQLRYDFRSVQFGLLVGVGGGIPNGEHCDIRLGDVVVGRSVVDLGHSYYITGATVSQKPPSDLQTAVQRFEAAHRISADPFLTLLEDLQLRHLEMKEYGYIHQGVENDQLFQPTYDHQGSNGSCCDCDPSQRVQRPGRDNSPRVHYGTIGSSSHVIRCGRVREELKRNGLLCVEMEAIGLMDALPCLVIRGISDYADSHKNKQWQSYAAATAAAYTKALLSFIPRQDIPGTATGLDDVQFSREHLECLRDLYVTDPRDDKSRIQDSEDELLPHSYSWILNEPDFLAWRDDEETRLLWIKGDPGIGKTMVMIGLIEELSKYANESPETRTLAYFFCQSSDNRLNNAVSILRGLIYFLIDEENALVEHLWKKYKSAGYQTFEGPNALQALCNILSEMLRDTRLPRVYLIVDALDECSSDVSRLLKWITRHHSNQVKWLLASRYRDDINDILRSNGNSRRQINLKSDSAHISQAVNTFVDMKAGQLGNKLKDQDTLQRVRRHLCENAGGTFLWVALACSRLQQLPSWKIQAELPQVLKEFPPGLEQLYEKMLKAIEKGEDPESRKRILATVVLSCRPMSLRELCIIAQFPQQILPILDSLRELVESCGSFLTIRQDTVYLVHQSARDYLFRGGRSKILITNPGQGHIMISHSCIEAMSHRLTKDLLQLHHPGAVIDEVNQHVIKSRLTDIQYACCYWVDHIYHAFQDQGHRFSSDFWEKVNIFLRKHVLHWLEALCWLRQISKARQMLSDLEYISQHAINREAEVLRDIVQDASGFCNHFRSIIETAPLQIYSSAVLFSPRGIIRNNFFSEIPSWVSNKSLPHEDWTPYLNMQEDQRDRVGAVAFSRDGSRVASGSEDQIARLWDTTTGALLHMLEGHKDKVCALAFSRDGDQLASGSRDQTILVWNTVSGELLQALKGHTDVICAVAFSPDARLASGSRDQTIRLWDIKTGSLLRKIEGHSNWVTTLCFSPDGDQLASGSGDCTVRLWTTADGMLQRKFEGHHDMVTVALFSPTGGQLVSGSSDNHLRVWDTSTGEMLRKLEGHTDCVGSVAFTSSGHQLASGSWDRTVRLWETQTGRLLQTMEGHLDSVGAVIFLPDGQLFSVSRDHTARIWDPDKGDVIRIMEGHKGMVGGMAFSPDSRKLAYASADPTVRLWDTTTGRVFQEMEGHLDWVGTVAFSTEGSCLASGSRDHTVRLWNTETGKPVHICTGHKSMISIVAFSFDNTKLASGARDGTIHVWDTATGETIKILEGHNDRVSSITFFPTDGSWLASGSKDSQVWLWNTTTGESLNATQIPCNPVEVVAVSPDGGWLAAGSSDGTVRVWKVINNSNSKSPSLKHTFQAHTRPVSDLFYSANCMYLVSGSEDCTVRVWRLDNGEAMQTFEGCHKSWAYEVANRLSDNLYIQIPSISVDPTGSWVTRDGEKVLLLPPERRPDIYMFRNNLLAMGYHSGGLTLLGFEEE